MRHFNLNQTAFDAVFLHMKIIQPIYETIKEKIETTELYIKVGKQEAVVQKVSRNPKGVFVYSSLGEHKVDLFTWLFVK